MIRNHLIDSILEQIRHLHPGERVLIADEIDRITWRDRVESLVESVEHGSVSSDTPTDAEIDQLVQEVRTEKPLYERYWTLRRSSAR